MQRIYTRKELEKMKRPALGAICKKLQIKQKGTNKSLLEQILQKQKKEEKKEEKNKTPPKTTITNTTPSDSPGHKRPPKRRYQEDEEENQIIITKDRDIRPIKRVKTFQRAQNESHQKTNAWERYSRHLTAMQVKPFISK